MAAPSQVGEKAASLNREVTVLQALSLLFTIPEETSIFSQFVVTNSRDDPSLHGGIFPQRLCMLELW